MVFKFQFTEKKNSFGTASEIINSEVKKHPESCAQSGIELHPICQTV